MRRALPKRRSSISIVTAASSITAASPARPGSSGHRNDFAGRGHGNRRRDSATVAIRAVERDQRVLHESGRQVVFGHRGDRLEDLERVAAKPGPEHDVGLDRRAAGNRAGDLRRHDRFAVRKREARARPVAQAIHRRAVVRSSPGQAKHGNLYHGGGKGVKVAEKVLAAVRTGPGKTEIREYPMPDIPEDAALLRMEVGGICGTDVKLYKHPPSGAAVIMGHENIGYIAKAGSEFTRRKGFKEGDLVFVEHYVSCGKCEWCHLGQYRHCENTDWRKNPDAIRYGYTSAEKPPHLWGGFAQYIYLPWNAVVHHVPKGVSPELAGLVTPMANGVEWSLFDGGVGYNSRVLIQGPGQQGLSQTVICKQAGASLIIVTGTSKDAARLAVAKKLGADYVIDVQKEDPLARIMQITGGKGVDVSLDCTAGAGTLPVLLGIEALKRKAGTIVVQGEMADFPNFPIGRMTVKYITVKSARGHSFKACELALQ